MPTQHRRINAVLEPPLYEEVQRLAKGEGVSLSQKVRDLVRDALELIEDEGWERLIRERRKHKGPWLTHEEVWGKRRR